MTSLHHLFGQFGNFSMASGFFGFRTKGRKTFHFFSNPDIVSIFFNPPPLSLGRRKTF